MVTAPRTWTCRPSAYQGKVTERFGGHDQVPVPAHWGGYRIAAEVVEFWQGRENRIHNRIRVLTAQDRVERLQP